MTEQHEMFSKGDIVFDRDNEEITVVESAEEEPVGTSFGIMYGLKNCDEKLRRPEDLQLLAPRNAPFRIRQAYFAVMAAWEGRRTTHVSFDQELEYQALNHEVPYGLVISIADRIYPGKRELMTEVRDDK